MSGLPQKRRTFGKSLKAICGRLKLPYANTKGGKIKK